MVHTNPKIRKGLHLDFLPELNLHWLMKINNIFREMLRNAVAVLKTILLLLRKFKESISKTKSSTLERNHKNK